MNAPSLGLSLACMLAAGGAPKGSLTSWSLSEATVASTRVAAKTYYVSPTGSNSNPGTLARPWRTITYAAGSTSPAPPNATIYIQAGNYGSEHVVVAKDGLKLIGYHSRPGDQPVILAKTASPVNTFEPSHQPLLNGGDRTLGIGINLRGRSNVTVSNINVTNYAYGVITGSTTRSFKDKHIIDNVNVSQIGNPNSGYSGYAISLGSMGTYFSNANTVRNCLITDSAAEGMSVYGDGNLVDNVKVFNTETVGAASMDYYVMVCGSTNRVENSLISRTPGSAHYGHGFSIKSNAEQVVDDGQSLPVINPQFNVIRNCVALNVGESFAVRHRGVRHNTFQDNKAFGTGSGSDCQGNGIVIRDGASENKFVNTTVANACSGIRFNDTVEDGDTGANPPGHPGNGNVIEGVSVRNTYYGVKFHNYSLPSDSGSNTIRDSAFEEVRYVFGVDRPAATMSYRNVSFRGTLGVLPPSIGGFRTGPFSSNLVPGQFVNCTFANIAGGMPPGF